MSDQEIQPEYSQLNNGMTPEDLKEAIGKSGYPFQATTAAALQGLLGRHFRDVKIQEEWEYIDRETQQARSVDILAKVHLTDFNFHGVQSWETLPIFSHLSLVIECKQSENPYIFFLRESPPEGSPSFPEMVGPIKKMIRIYDRVETGEVLSKSSAMSSRAALGFYEFNYILPSLPYAISFAKIMRNKSKIELSGEETYRALTYPLLKAVDHLRSIADLDQQLSQLFFIPIAIVRAPMFGSIFMKNGEQRLISLPWVRVSRLEPSQNSSGMQGFSDEVRYFDVVHESHLEKYIEHLVSAFSQISQRIVEHSGELRAGVGSGYPTAISRPYESLEKLPQDFPVGLEDIYPTVYAHYSGVSFENTLEGGQYAIDGAWEINWQ